MKKPGSLDYLKRLSDAVLTFHETYENAVKAGQSNLIDWHKCEQDWKAIAELATEIREALGSFKKGRKSANQHLER